MSTASAPLFRMLSDSSSFSSSFPPTPCLPRRTCLANPVDSAAAENATAGSRALQGPRNLYWRTCGVVTIVYILFHSFVCVSGGDQAAIAGSGLCQDHFPNDPAVLNYCQNGATCNVQLTSGQLLQIICNCAELQTTEYLYAGPSCSIKQKLAFVAGSFGTSVRNTSWLENLLGLNSWKDVPSRVASFCYTVPCPSPDGSSI
ncbi:UNVERIFIED_CONTAM: hypothetical protein HHA_314415 [Hammondia hammondi]|eukprot:XP_008883491.1 hypothetical protein HHA_314415 [Hammondia hammondi]